MSVQRGLQTLTLLACVTAARSAAGEFADGLVILRSGSAAVHELPNDGSPAIAWVQAGYGVTVTVPCGAEDVAWCRVAAREWTGVGSSGPIQRGWIKTQEMFYSPAIAQLMRDRQVDARELFATDIARARGNELVSTWLRLYLSLAHEQSDRVDDAITTLNSAVAVSAPNSLLPFAYLDLAKLNLRRQDVNTALNVYQQLLRRFPGYTLQLRDCYGQPLPDRVYCDGSPRIQERVDATRTFLAVRQRTENTIATATSAPQKAAAWYELGRAWETKEAIDPAQPTEGRRDTSEARRCYEAVVQLAPGSAVAGTAAWRLIEFSEPYEWEGHWDAEAAWSLGRFGAFAAAYPSHELTGDALFKIAQATWAKAGFPEVYGYVFTPGDWNARLKELSPWFDTGGFGGGRGEFVPQHPDQTRAAQKLFQDIVDKYPRSKSAAMAAYYVAVIDDYCLKDGRRSLTEYERFVRAYGDTKIFADKARERVASLRTTR